MVAARRVIAANGTYTRTAGPVHLGPWLLDDAGRLIADHAPAHLYAVISDANVGPVCGPQLLASLRRAEPQRRILYREIEPGESGKSRENWSALTDWLLDERCGRDTTVVALGGGVVGDLAGFVAATLLRGVPLVQVPTTLLAMVDASIGGKVGVDTRHGKNLAGAFHPSALVLIDPVVLQTLPARELRAGYAEVIKHGVICDKRYFAETADFASHLLGDADLVDWGGERLASLIARSVEIKAEVVGADPTERGPRRNLNFGHTVGHAVESASRFSLLHGEAVAVGMALESRLAETLGLADRGLTDVIVESLSRAGLPTELPGFVDRRVVLSDLNSDKKRIGGVLHMALPREVGAMAAGPPDFAVAVTTDAVARLLGA
ncbi:MAG: 3-dehydroquinate synthase [Gemmatimonadota bacterium]